MTTPETFFTSFWFIIFMVLMGVVTHWMKQLAMMKKATPTGLGHISFREYWVVYWPETLMALTSAAAAVALLYEMEHLTAASAWGAGYLGNSAADLIGGRVQAMISAGTRSPPPQP